MWDWDDVYAVARYGHFRVFDVPSTDAYKDYVLG